MMKEIALNIFVFMCLVVVKSKCTLNHNLSATYNGIESEKRALRNEFFGPHKLFRYTNVGEREFIDENTEQTKMNFTDGSYIHRHKFKHVNISRVTKDNLETPTMKDITSSAKLFHEHSRKNVLNSIRYPRNCSDISCFTRHAYIRQQGNIQLEPSQTHSGNQLTRFKRRAIHHRFINWKAESERYIADDKHFSSKQYQKTGNRESPFDVKGNPSDLTFISQNPLHSRSVLQRQSSPYTELKINNSYHGLDPLLFTRQLRSKARTEQTQTSTTVHQKRQKGYRSLDGKGNLSDVPFRWPDSAYVDGPTAAAARTGGPASQSTSVGDRNVFYLASKDPGSLPRGSEDQPLQGERSLQDVADHRLRHKSSRAIRGRSRGVEVLAGQSVLLPCDLRPPNPSDPPRLLLWLRAGSHMPIVSIDYRENGGGRVWRDPESSMAVRLKLHLPPSSPLARMLKTGNVTLNEIPVFPDLESLAGNDPTLEDLRTRRGILKPQPNHIDGWEKETSMKNTFSSSGSSAGHGGAIVNPNSLPSDDGRQKFSPTSVWFENNNVAGGGNDLGSSGGLVLEQARLDDAGLYRCRVDFLQSPSRNVRVNLTVVDPVRSVSVNWKSLGQQGNDAGQRGGDSGQRGSAVQGVVGPFKEGDNPTLECFANNGLPKPSVEWWEGSRRLTDAVQSDANPKIQVVSMRPGPLTRQDFGRQFTCLGYNSNLTAPVTQTVAVHLTLPVVAVKLEVPEKLVAGETAEMHCTAWGSFPPPTVSWILGTDTLSPSNKWVSDDGNVSVSVLSFTPQSRHDGSKLSCSAYNHALGVKPTTERGTGASVTTGSGKTHSVVQLSGVTLVNNSDAQGHPLRESPEETNSGDSVVLDVNYAPRVKAWLGRSLDGTRVKEGDDVYFECDVRAKPPPHKLTWTHDSEEVEAVPFVLLTNLTLVLQKVTRKSAGRYSCSALNTLGQATSAPITLDIKFAPVCSHDTAGKHSVGKQENAHVSCSVLANPPQVDFFWTFNNTAEVLNVPRDRYVVEGRDSLVNYTPVTDLDYGTLLCSASNEIGRQSTPCVFQIVPAGKPGPPHNCQPDDVTLTSLNIVCLSGDDGGLNQTFFLQVLLAGGSRVVSDQRSDEPEFFVSHLHPGTSYELRVTAENSRGSSRSAVAFVATLQLSPASESNAEPTRGRGLGTGSGMSILVMVAITCVPVAAILLLAVLTTRAVLRAKARRKRNDGGVADRKSSTASTLGDASVPAPEDDREDAAMLTSLPSVNKQIVDSRGDPTCWCDRHASPHPALADCSNLSSSYSPGRWDGSLLPGQGRIVSQVPDLQLGVVAAVMEHNNPQRPMLSHRKEHLPNEPLPPPLGYNQGYLPTECSNFNSTLGRHDYHLLGSGRPQMNQQVFVNRGYSTLDTRMRDCNVGGKTGAKLPMSGSFEMESNVAGSISSSPQHDRSGGPGPRSRQPSTGVTSIQDRMQSHGRGRHTNFVSNNTSDGQESCV